MMADVDLKVRIAIHESAHAACARVLRLRAGTIDVPHSNRFHGVGASENFARVALHRPSCALKTSRI